MKQKKESVRERRAGVGEAPLSDQETSLRRKAVLEQRHLEAYKNMHRLRRVLYQRYSDLLNEKVRGQREEIKRYKAPEHPRQQGGDIVKKQKLPRSTLSQDDTHLKSLHITRYYLCPVLLVLCPLCEISDLEGQMARRGWLKTRQDRHQLRTLLEQEKRPAQLSRRLQDIRKQIVSKSAPDMKCVDWTRRKSLAPVPGVQITTDEGVPQESGTSSERGISETTSAHHPSRKLWPELDMTEQMFPKLRVPTFVNRQPGFLDQFKTTALPVWKICEPPQKSRTTERNLRKLHHMYRLSFTNMAASQRLLDRDRHCPCWEEYSIGNLTWYEIPSEVSAVKPSAVGEGRLPRFSADSEPHATQTEKPVIPEVSKEQSARTAPSTGVLSPELVPPCTEETSHFNKPRDPLSLEELFQQNLCVASRSYRKTWTNYVDDH